MASAALEGEHCLRLADHLLRLDLAVLDELGHLSFDCSEGAMLFHLLSEFYE